MSTETREQMLAQCKRIADELGGEWERTWHEEQDHIWDEDEEVWRDEDGDECYDEPSISDWFDGALSVEVRASLNGEYLSAEVCVAYGGPSIYVDTKDRTVRGYWGSETCAVSFTDAYGLDDYLAELWECNH